jgi:hypothetical protein
VRPQDPPLCGRTVSIIPRPRRFAFVLLLIRHATRRAAAFSGTCPGKQFIFLAAVVSPARCCRGEPPAA